MRRHQRDFRNDRGGKIKCVRGELENRKKKQLPELPDSGFSGGTRTFPANGEDRSCGARRLACDEPRLAAHVGHDPCPNAEDLQSRMVQMKTDYGSGEELKTQIAAFVRTMEQLNRRY